MLLRLWGWLHVCHRIAHHRRSSKGIWGNGPHRKRRRLLRRQARIGRRHGIVHIAR
jgi:hypothetical protein